MTENENNIIDFIAVNLAELFDDEKNMNKDYTFFESAERISQITDQIKAMRKFQTKELFSEKRLAELKEIIISRAKAKVLRGGGKDRTIAADNSLWLNSKRQDLIGWENTQIKTYRDRYFAYLKKYKSRGKEQLANTKASSLRAIQNIGDPLGVESFNSRGLIVGPVQGGKTEHFNGVVATAFDAGYHLVIVLSGIMEDLRVQTQNRIREDLLGSSQGGLAAGAEKVISFGPQPVQQNVDPINVLTSSSNDFNATVADGEESLSASKTLIVCKKNGAILKQLLMYLENQVGNSSKEIPVLIIDDEADNASLNNNSHRGETAASLMNKRIRAILKLFTKSAYIGYTASPFANILQHRERNRNIEKDAFKHKGKEYQFEVCDSLFPKHFIELIEPPPTYVGLKQLFDTNAEITKLRPAFGRKIEDDLRVFPRRIDKKNDLPTTLTGKGTRAANKEDLYPKNLTGSLEEAVYCFILAVAIRKTRSRELRETPFHQPHNTMLIHVSRFINWQTRTKDLLSKFIDQISERLSNEPLNRDGGIYGTLEKQFDLSFATSLTMGIDEYLPENYVDEYMSVVSFDKIRPLLAATVAEIECVALNSFTKDSLEYKEENPKTYIAIGGNRLARGFTLEGLTVCYFIRDTNFADTLLQMGRWFGYRMGYLDCCKLFFTDDAIDKFDSISRTVEDLESTIEDLSKDPTSTPETYALKVASNPGVIKLTRNSILKNTDERKVSFDDHLEQTYKFSVDDKSLESAYLSVSKLISGESSNFKWEERNSMMVYRGANSRFVKQLLECESSFARTNIQEILRYIQECNKEGKLTDWTIAIKTKGKGAEIASEDFGFKDIQLHSSIRQITKVQESRANAIKDLNNHSIFRAGGRSTNFAEASDMKVTINDPDAINNAVEEWRNDNPNKLSGPPEKIFRHLLTAQQGVIILYLIDSNAIFKEKSGEIIKELQKKALEITTNKPFIGLAIGTPKISNSPKVVYIEDQDISIYQNETDNNEDPTILDEIIGDHFDL
jgi:hypothetical protein